MARGWSSRVHSRRGELIEKFHSRDINISPDPVGELPGLDNHAMGIVFEDLVSMFNEDNNEEAG